MSSTVNSTSASSASGTNSSRVTGMYSQLDTDALVKKLVSRQQQQIDTAYQQKTINQWKESAWNEIQDAVQDFSDTYTSTLGSASMLKSSTYVSYAVHTDDKTGAVKVTAGTDALASRVKVTVSQVAKNAAVSSTSAVSADGKTEIASSNNEELSKLNLAKPLQFDGNGAISFSINGKTFSFSKDTTLQNMINTVNSDKDAGVTMKYSRLTDTFTVTADSGGSGSEVDIKNLSGNAFGENSAFGITNGSFTDGRKDAILTIDDGSGPVPLTRNSNNFTIDGLTYDLEDVTSDPISFSVDRDYSTTTDAIKKFSDSLNTLLTKLTGYTSGKDNSQDYPPLTEAQKDSMSEDQINKWEEKSKTGILRHDATLERLISDLKSAFFTDAGGTGYTAASIGISTASYYSSDAGKLEVDEDALKNMLATDPARVISIFTGGNSTVSDSQQGVVYKLRNTISTFKKTSNSTIGTLTTKIDDATKSISTLEDKLSDLSEKYYKKFSEMETALSKLNSTSSMLSSLFSK